MKYKCFVAFSVVVVTFRLAEWCPAVWVGVAEASVIEGAVGFSAATTSPDAAQITSGDGER